VLITVVTISWIFLAREVDVFSDGSVHTNIVDYIREHQTIPVDDFAGQININFRQPRSFNVPMIYPQNVYIFFASVGMLTWLESKHILDGVNLLAILVAWFFFFHTVQLLTKSRKIASVAVGLFFLLPFRYWLLVRRLIEPMSLLFCFTALYVLLQGNEHGKGKHIMLLWFLMFIIFYTKQSNIYFLVFLIAFGLLTTWKIKEMFLAGIAFVVLGFPALHYSYQLLGAISPVPPWIPYVDTTLLKPRRQNQSIEERENNLNDNVSNEVIKKITYNQFTEHVQISPLEHLKTSAYTKVVQNFLPFQFWATWTQGYHLPLPKPIGLLNTLLLLAGCLFLLWTIKTHKKYLLFSVLSVAIVALFAIKFTVFRYYLNSIILHTMFFAYGAYMLYKQGNKISSLLVFTLIVVFWFLTISLELNKNLAYTNSIGHRLTNNSWWLAELQELAHSDILSASGDLFTPVLEAAYYLDRKIYWDEKFFFVKDKEFLLSSLQAAWVRYILNPFYSNTVQWSRWRYYDGIPADSLLGKMLTQEECFTRVYAAEAFDLYLMQEACADTNDAPPSN
jgi:hypothetical protein